MDREILEQLRALSEAEIAELLYKYILSSSSLLFSGR